MNSKTNSNWYFSKEQVLKHYGADSKLEISYRRASAAFIQDVGIRLKMPQLTIATAISYFHRFFIRHHLKDHDRFIVATACLFLAGKVEETPRKLDDVIKISYMAKNKKKGEPEKVVQPSQNEHNVLRNKVLQNEHLILTTIAFELVVEHPYKYLLEYMKTIQGSKNLCQVAWNFVNDSLRTSLCLHYPPDLISYASVYLATRFLNFKLPTDCKKEWWELLGINFEVLEDISKQILDLYESNPFANENKNQNNQNKNSTINNKESNNDNNNNNNSNNNNNNSSNNNSSNNSSNNDNNSNNSNNTNDNNNTDKQNEQEQVPSNDNGDARVQSISPPTNTTTSTSLGAAALNPSANTNYSPSLQQKSYTSSSSGSSSNIKGGRFSPYHKNPNKRSLSRSPSPNNRDSAVPNQ